MPEHMENFGAWKNDMTGKFVRRNKVSQVAVFTLLDLHEVCFPAALPV